MADEWSRVAAGTPLNCVLETRRDSEYMTLRCHGRIDCIGGAVEWRDLNDYPVVPPPDWWRRLP